MLRKTAGAEVEAGRAECELRGAKTGAGTAHFTPDRQTVEVEAELVDWRWKRLMIIGVERIIINGLAASLSGGDLAGPEGLRNVAWRRLLARAPRCVKGRCGGGAGRCRANRRTSSRNAAATGIDYWPGAAGGLEGVLRAALSPNVTVRWRANRVVRGVWWTNGPVGPCLAGGRGCGG